MKRLGAYLFQVYFLFLEVLLNVPILRWLVLGLVLLSALVVERLDD